ncbi:MAG: endonuclease/exonuclease/phosphatase family protein [Acidobacteria bacterium]|nr:endonuclease/exonuclease/phosphatase family protein [Acidobacteriota bacterium]
MSLFVLALCCTLPRDTLAKGHTLRVMTYNIRTGIGEDKRLDLARVADVIKRARADLVGLQEVDRGVERTHRVDEIAELARLTGMEYAFANNLRYQGGWYGVAILSRFPIEGTDHRRYLNTREAERRGFVRVRVSAWGRPLDFVTTHLDYQHEDGRVFEARQLLEALGDDGSVPLVITGDFNEEPGAEAYRLTHARFADAWSDAHADGGGGDDVGRTYPADKPTKRIDYVFYKPGGLRATGARVVQTEASDHRPLVVTFRWDDKP